MHLRKEKDTTGIVIDSVIDILLLQGEVGTKAQMP